MSLAPVRRLSQALLQQQVLRPAGCGAARGFAAKAGDPLESDTRTTGPQQVAHETDEATKYSIRHAAEGKPGEAMKDIGQMAKNAAKGATESAKLMADSLKEKAKGATKGASEAAQDKP